jgi:hypothetical protein
MRAVEATPAESRLRCTSERVTKEARRVNDHLLTARYRRRHGSTINGEHCRSKKTLKVGEFRRKTGDAACSDAVAQLVVKMRKQRIAGRTEPCDCLALFDAFAQLHTCPV